jgi:hypothetical protein
MDLLYRIQITVAGRLRWLMAQSQRDRGDSPIPSAVIMIGLAVIAAGMLILLGALVRGYINQAPTIPAF